MLMIFLFLLLGGPSAARFAGNQLVNLLSLLNDPNEPTVLKMVGNQTYIPLRGEWIYILYLLTAAHLYNIANLHISKRS